MRILLSIVAVGLFCAACADRNLGRAQATQLIAANLPAKSYELVLPVGEHCSWASDSGLFVNGAEYPKVEDFDRRLREVQIERAMSKEALPQGLPELVRRGLVTFAAEKATGCPDRQDDPIRNIGFVFARWTLGVTDAGRAAGLGPAPLVLANREFSEVTGITTEPESADAIAEYTWRWKLTEFGQRVSFIAPDERPVSGQAHFRRYDDGWRLVRVE